MKRTKTAVALVAAALIGMTAPQAWAHGPGSQGMMGPGMMGQTGGDGDEQGAPPYGPGYGMGYGRGYGMMAPGYGGYGMMGPGMMGYGYGMPMMGYGGYGMMGPGMMGYGMPMMGYGGYGMMGPGMMGPGMMGYGMPGYGGGYGMMPYGAPGAGRGGAGALDLKTADVQRMLEARLQWSGNPNLKVGKVTEKDANTITAEIVTKDGSLVRGFEVDRHSGFMRPVK